MWFRIALTLGIYAAAVAETAILEQPHTLQVCWLMLVASLAMWRLPAMEAAGWGVGIGLICDAISGTPLGLHLLALSLAVWGACFVRDQWLGQSLAAYGVLSMLVVAVVVLSVAGLRSALGEEIVSLSHTGLSAVGAAAATGLCGLVLVIVWRTTLYAAAANGLIPRRLVEPRVA